MAIQMTRRHFAAFAGGTRG